MLFGASVAPAINTTQQSKSTALTNQDNQNLTNSIGFNPWQDDQQNNSIINSGLGFDPRNLVTNQDQKNIYQAENSKEELELWRTRHCGHLN